MSSLPEGDALGALSIVAAAESSPSRDAARFPGSTWSYLEAARAAVAATGTFTEARLNNTGRPVALVASPDRSGLAAFYALLQAEVPVLLLSPRSPPAARLSLIQRVGAALVVDEDGAHEREWSPGMAPLVAGDQILVATSGTSGGPKLVTLTRANLLESARASAANLPLSAHDCWGLTLPFSHVGGLSVITRCLLARASIAVATAPLTAKPSWRFLEDSRVTLLSLVPTQLSRALSSGVVPPATLRHVLLGGAPSVPSLRARARDAGWSPLCTYGLTEACSQVATQSPDSPVRHPDNDSGKPLPGFEVKVNEAGRICVRGPAVMRGYYPEEAHPSGAWFETGDLGRLSDDGRLTVLGRADEVIISGGENVSPELVEQCLLTLPQVEDACVVGVPDEEWGYRVVALLQGPPDTEDTLKIALKGLIDGHAVPKNFLWVEELPRLANHKIDRRAARKLAENFLSESTIDPPASSGEMSPP